AARTPAGNAPTTSRRGSRRRALVAEPAQQREREDAGLVAVAPDEAQRVAADELDAQQQDVRRDAVGIEQLATGAFLDAARARPGQPQLARAELAGRAVLPADAQQERRDEIGGLRHGFGHGAVRRWSRTAAGEGTACCAIAARRRRRT